jgi:hypothetical protein
MQCSDYYVNYGLTQEILKVCDLRREPDPGALVKRERSISFGLERH